MTSLHILVGCETSGVVRRALAARGGVCTLYPPSSWGGLRPENFFAARAFPPLQ